MTERDASRTTQEITAPAPGATATDPAPAAPAGAPTPPIETPAQAPPAASPDAVPDGADAAPAGPPAGPSPAPVSGRASLRARPSGPLTRMGPWAPVAGALLGVVLAIVAVLWLAGLADDFRDRLSLVFLVVGMGLLGASGTLLADEVRMVRWRAREAALRPAAWADTTASLVNGLTPARLLLLVAGFVLFLAAYVAVR
jgi:hypothetical protein